MSVIYEPKGRAREYSELACNLYKGCGHKCLYCYGPRVTKTSREEFQKPTARKNILRRLEADVSKASKVQRKKSVLLSFTSDPYQMLDQKLKITRGAIKILHAGGFKVTVLTKGGPRAERDFDLMGPRDTHAVTLTLLNNAASRKWEPKAALPLDRIKTLREAHHVRGMKTWVSLEPVIDPDAVYKIIALTYPYVDLYKVGVLNYHPHAKTIDWAKFAIEVVDRLEEYGCEYYLKEDLRKWIPF